MRTRRATAMREPDLDPRDHLTPFAARHRDLFNAHILPKMKTPARACPCGHADEVPSCRIHYAVLHALNRTFRKLVPGFRAVMRAKNELHVMRSDACARKSVLQYFICRNTCEKFVKELYRYPYMSGPFAGELHTLVRTTLSEAPVRMENHETSCEECGADICVFCAAACLRCYGTWTCFACAETSDRFMFCPSCERPCCMRAGCSDYFIYCDMEGCDAFKCDWSCGNSYWTLCELCDMIICDKCADVSGYWNNHIVCDRCGKDICLRNNENFMMTSLDVCYCSNTCAQEALRDGAVTTDRAHATPQNATNRKPKSPSVSPRMSFSGDQDVEV